jgi:hypothetical protein
VDNEPSLRRWLAAGYWLTAAQQPRMVRLAGLQCAVATALRSLLLWYCCVLRAFAHPPWSFCRTHQGSEPGRAVWINLYYRCTEVQPRGCRMLRG